MQEVKRMDLVNKLIATQEAMGLSDAAFAAKLGVTPGLWNRTKNGFIKPRFELLAGVARVFPGLGKDVINYLATTERSPRTERRSAVA
jgi:transcriptional regulator with XRE-family HTH domain